MAKIRTVKPELFRHEALFEAEKYYQLPLRLAFIGLFSCCDREGRFRWEPRSLKLDILPYDDINFSDVLNALWVAGFIKKYTWQNKFYGHIPTWHQHQSINKHEPASKLPDPERCEYEKCVPKTESTLHMPLPALHMHAYAKQEAISASKKLEKFTSEEPSERQNLPLSLEASTVLPPTSSPCTFSPTEPTLICNSMTIDKNHSNKVNTKNLANPLPEPIFEKSALASSTQNQDLHKPISAIHMHACALHEEASAAHVHASLEVEVEMEGELEQEVERELEGKVEIKNLGDNPNIVARTSSPDASQRIVAQARQGSSKSAQISAIFSHWKITLQHPQAVLDKKRQRLIHQALQQGYTVAQLCDAISGCAQTPHNLGENERGQRYDGLHIILRDADQIERFIHNYHHPPRPPSPADQLLRANISAGENWLKHKQKQQGDL